MSGYVHEGRKSLWNGTVTTLCGITWPKGVDRREPRIFAAVNCPSCIAARKGKK